MRPRSLTACPFLRAQSRVAPACSRSIRPPPPVARDRPPPEARPLPLPPPRLGGARAPGRSAPPSAPAGAPGSGAVPTAAADLAGGLHVARQRVAHLLGVLVGQVDLVARAVEREAHGLVGGDVLVEVVAEDHLDLARHSLCFLSLGPVAGHSSAALPDNISIPPHGAARTPIAGRGSPIPGCIRPFHRVETLGKSQRFRSRNGAPGRNGPGVGK